MTAAVVSQVLAQSTLSSGQTNRHIDEFCHSKRRHSASKNARYEQLTNKTLELKT